LTEQLTAIKQAAQQGLINPAQALVLWNRARRDRETDIKEAILSNSACTLERVGTHDFEVQFLPSMKLQQNHGCDPSWKHGFVCHPRLSCAIMISTVH
jgi:hypothetical protein